MLWGWADVGFGDSRYASFTIDLITSKEITSPQQPPETLTLHCFVNVTLNLDFAFVQVWAVLYVKIIQLLFHYNLLHYQLKKIVSKRKSNLLHTRTSYWWTYTYLPINLPIYLPNKIRINGCTYSSSLYPY